jgi:hypothetical protein
MLTKYAKTIAKTRFDINVPIYFDKRKNALSWKNIVKTANFFV